MKYLLIKYVSFFSNEEIMYKAFLRDINREKVIKNFS